MSSGDSEREFTESPWKQGTDEKVAYKITTTAVVSSPTSVTVTLEQLPDDTDVSSTKLLGTASTVGDVITTPQVSGLAEDVMYRLVVSFLGSDGNTYSAFGYIVGEE